MARKQALRELQTRLAERMRAARLQAPERAWLAIECAGRGFLVPLTDAGEIFTAVDLVALPHARPWCLGVANLRGQLHTVVDLAAFLGLATAAPRATSGGASAAHEPAQLLALNPSLDTNAALRFDRLAGLRRQTQMTACEAVERQPPADADAERPQPASKAADKPVSAAGRPAFAGGRLRDAEGRVWQELKLAALARHPAFLRIGA